MDRGIVYDGRKCPGVELEVFIDSSFADQPHETVSGDGCKSTPQASVPLHPA